jgi:hypothetical protein
MEGNGGASTPRGAGCAASASLCVTASACVGSASEISAGGQARAAEHHRRDPALAAETRLELLGDASLLQRPQLARRAALAVTEPKRKRSHLLLDVHVLLHFGLDALQEVLQRFRDGKQLENDAMSTGAAQRAQLQARPLACDCTRSSSVKLLATAMQHRAH